MNTKTLKGPIALNELLDSALNKLTAEPAKPSATRTDGFLFSGNRHDSVPRALLLDRRLTPLERNAWQVFRLMLNEDGITAFPTYEQLRPWLASTPCAGPGRWPDFSALAQSRPFGDGRDAVAASDDEPVNPGHADG